MIHPHLVGEDPEVAEFDALRSSDWWQERSHARPACERAVIRSDGVRFPSITKAAKAVDRTFGNLSDCLNGRLKTCAGYTWRFADNG